MLNKIKQSMKQPHTSTVTPYMKFKRERIIGILFIHPQKLGVVTIGVYAIQNLTYVTGVAMFENICFNFRYFHSHNNTSLIINTSSIKQINQQLSINYIIFTNIRWDNISITPSKFQKYVFINRLSYILNDSI